MVKGKELVEVVGMENNSFTTIPFDRTIQYFGHIKTLIDVQAGTKTNTEYAYSSGLAESVKKTEIKVDKAAGEITEAVEKSNEAIQATSTLRINVEDISTRVTDTTTSVNDLNQQFTILNESITSQTSSAITEWFNQSGIQGTLDQLQTATQNNSEAVSQISSYIKRGIITDESSPFYGEAYIELGDQSNQTTLRILPERIQFLTNGVETAYISNNTLYINESTILSRQQIGHWVTEQDSSGNLNTKWVN